MSAPRAATIRVALALALLVGCSATPRGRTTLAETEAKRELQVLVTLDGSPAEGVTVSQGGSRRFQTTDAAGAATLELVAVEGEQYVVASHPQARAGSIEIPAEGSGPVTVELETFGPDNPDYVFRDPGPIGEQGTTAQCNHCHQTLHADWAASPHRTAASNPHVQDAYAGTAQLDAAACSDAGGTWATGPLPGGGEGERCYLGLGVLPTLNGCDGPCVEATEYGGCADCHAPGIDGQLGGRDLREAEGHAYDSGVHCDVCHRVEAVDTGATESGVAGKLRLHRPSEGPRFGFPNEPLVFGPHHDVGSPVMGLVQRDHFAHGDFCGGCHEHRQPVLVPGQSIDTARWPDGRLPVDTTWTEWREGPIGDSTHCQGCHMPPAPEVTNGADLQDLDGLEPGLVPGWIRPPGGVRHHSWVGPRQPESNMLQLAATVSVEHSVSDGVLTAQVTTRNAGPAHAIPGGVPLRTMVLTVAARCGEQALVATGGDAVPAFGGAWQSKADDWSTWPGAQVGDVVRVVGVDGWRDYAGWGPFGDGTFDAAGKGLPNTTVLGQSTVVAVEGDAVTFDAPLPDGDLAYRGDGRALAGAPGFAFARLLVDAEGARVPSFAAVDVASDNRLLPAQAVVTTHTFASPCPDPTVEATLLYRSFPLDLAAERGWADADVVMARELR